MAIKKDFEGTDDDVVIVDVVSLSNYNMPDGEHTDVFIIGNDVYIGKDSQYENGKRRYHNSDDSLEFLTDRTKVFHLLFGRGYGPSQREMIENGGFTEEDYAEFQRLRDGPLSKYVEVSVPEFGDTQFQYPMPEDDYSASTKKMLKGKTFNDMVKNQRMKKYQNPKMKKGMSCDMKEELNQKLPRQIIGGRFAVEGRVKPTWDETTFHSNDYDEPYVEVEISFPDENHYKIFGSTYSEAHLENGEIVDDDVQFETDVLEYTNPEDVRREIENILELLSRDFRKSSRKSKKMKKSDRQELRDTANALFDGDWRASDRDWLKEEFQFDDDELDIVCERLEELESEYNASTRKSKKMKKSKYDIDKHTLIHDIIIPYTQRFRFNLETDSDDKLIIIFDRDGELNMYSGNIRYRLEKEGFKATQLDDFRLEIEV